MKHVFVGLSGGVDSALSAYLLKQQGYKVTGVFLKVWEPDFLPCTSGQDRLDAMRVAAHLGIPFLTYNLEEEYKKSVVDYFVNEYKKGRTPNPDVMCNRSIKFGSFWERAQKEGADYIATGHYAQAREVRGKRALYQGADPSKDQSYFLWTLTQDDLEHVLFPIGHLNKTEVRAKADEAGLPNATKKDSQGLCFLGHVDMHEFLKHYIPVEKGFIKNEKGEKIGEHDGVYFYTLNQRINVATGEKLYVVGKDKALNELHVSSNPEEGVAGSTTYTLSDVNWIREQPSENKTYNAHIRYHSDDHPVNITGSKVTFGESALIAEGQSLVVYDSETNECIGGGIIESDASPDNR